MDNSYSTISKRSTEFKFAIITALDEEFSAVRRALKGGIVKSISDMPFKHSVCTIQVDGTSINGEIFQPQDTGRVEAAIMTGYILSRRQYKYIILVGVAGGLSGGKSQNSNKMLTLGDVVFASEIIDSEFQKITDFGVEYRDRSVRMPSGYISHYLEYIKDFNSQKMSSHNGTHNGSRFNLHLGSVVSGSKIVASRQKQKEIAGWLHKELPLAVEMEGIAVAIASFRFNPNGGFVMIRGISDFADENKNIDEYNWRKAACQHAAETAIDYIYHIAKDYKWAAS